MPEPFRSTSLSPAYTEIDDDPEQVEYIEMRVKTALHHASRPYGSNPFHYTLNLYRGCRHGCPFCFARYTHWFLGFQNAFDFQRKIQVKVNLLEVLEKELADPRRRRDWVSLGAATDPYQPAEKKYGLARGAFRLLARYGWPAAFSTKSDLLLRDLDVLKDVAESSGAAVAMTLTTLDPALQKLLEPHAVPVERRLEALRRLKSSGIPCGIHLMPIIPFLTDGPGALEAMVQKAAEIGVDYFVYNVLRLRGQVVRNYYFQVLKAYDKDLFFKTLRLYGSRPHPPEDYKEALYRKVDFYRKKWGVQNHWRDCLLEKQLRLL